MGIINKGILGGFSGKVGTVIGGTWKGIDYMRSQSSSKRSSFTQPQLEQQAKFALSVKFLQPIAGLLAVSFKDYAIKMTGFNNALRYTLTNAVSGSYPAYTVDYSMALVSRGDLPNALSPAASSAGGGVNFTWTNNAGTGKAMPTDKSILVVYCPAKNQCIYTTTGPERSTQAGSLAVSSFIGEQVETYIGFISEDGKVIASSAFTGTLTVA
ncbi:MAG: hypothetical protein HYR66_04155 [Sphingobacteriales bacterium]|nr:hypothetical protein [Sphingobacteriales bacterium]MBI3719694.1 hypothetical protein [Sphingobacteriales bacterium]